MAEYDLKRLEVAIQYIKRMSEGRNPVTNRPAPENEVLTNANVNRCLKFVEEILRDVHGAGGKVGAVPGKERAAKVNIAETFPYEILEKYRYERDQQISYFLNQLAEGLPEGETMPVGAVRVNNWLRDNGYLEKRMMQDTGNENTVPTEKGQAIGIYSEKAGMPPREYYRIYYNEQAQRFLIENFRRILTEEEEKSAQKKARRQKEKDEQKRQRRQDSLQRAEQQMPYGQQARHGQPQAEPYGQEARHGQPQAKPYGQQARHGQPQAEPYGRRMPDQPQAPAGGAASRYPDDPAFDSLLASIPDDYSDALYSRENNTIPDPGFSDADFMGDGWETVDGEGLPW